MSGAGAIACIGGGGFLVDDASHLQERYLLTLLPEPRRARPRVLFLGLAHGDSEARQLKAYKMLAGISAGANCWFEHYVTDSVPGGGIRAGLGWLAGTFCPHLDSEAWRQAVLAGAPNAPAYGAREGVVMTFRDGALADVVADKPNAVATRRRPGDAAAGDVPARDLSLA